MNNQTKSASGLDRARRGGYRFFLVVAAALVASVTSHVCSAAPTNVRIQGANSTHVARVNALGELAVAAKPVAPNSSWTTVNNPTLYPGGPSNVVLWSGLGRNKVSFTSLIASATAATAGSVGVYIQVYVSDSSAGDCVTLAGGSFGAAERFVFQVPVGQTVQLTWPSPLVLSNYGDANRKVCIDASVSGGVASPTVSLFASGYLN